MSLFCLYKLTEEKTGNQGITPEYAVVTSEMGKRVLAQKFTHVMLTSCFQSERLPRKRKKQSTTQSTIVHDMVQAIRDKEEEALPLQEKPSTSEIILEAELDLAKRELAFFFIPAVSQ